MTSTAFTLDAARGSSQGGKRGGEGGQSERAPHGTTGRRSEVDTHQLAPLRSCVAHNARRLSLLLAPVPDSFPCCPLAAMDATEDAPAAPAAAAAAAPEAPAEPQAVKPLTPVNMLRPGTSGHDLVVKARATPRRNVYCHRLRSAHARPAAGC